MQINDKSFCIVFQGKQLFAFDESCPHANQSLFGANCEENTVICPVHKFKFNLTSGQGHGLSLQNHLIKCEDDQYFISFKD